MKIQKKIGGGGGGGGSGGEGSGWGGGGCQCTCDRRIEVFGKIHQKKKFRGGGRFGRVRVGGGQGGCE